MPDHTATNVTPASRREPKGVHLVGSVPLRDTRQVLETTCGVLGHHIRRVPDGETGERNLWVMWQLPALAKNPAFVASRMGVTQSILSAYARSRSFRSVINFVAGRLTSKQAMTDEERRRKQNAAVRIRLRPGVGPDDITIGPLGYSVTALESYATFERLKTAGVIPPHVRFQVSVPTPTAGLFFFPLDQQLTIAPAYERRLLAEIAEIATAIPHEQLAVQWDTSNEFGILEGVMSSPYGPDPMAARQPLIDLLVRIGDAVPRDVEVGYHMCYGDFGHKHFKEPPDTSKIVDMVNALAAGLTRPLSWVHFPVPRNRADDNYFAPLRDMRVPAETELYAGLIHYTDGVEGARRRIDALGRALNREFGIGTECGMGRRDPTTIPDLLRLHAKLASPVHAA